MTLFSSVLPGMIQSVTEYHFVPLTARPAIAERFPETDGASGVPAHALAASRTAGALTARRCGGV